MGLAVTTARIDLPQGTLDLLILCTRALEPQLRVDHLGTDPTGVDRGARTSRRRLDTAADSWRMLTAAVGQILDTTWLRT